jgi:allantoin racemase
MWKVVVLVPFALDAEGMQNRKDQLNAVTLGPDIQFDFRPVKAGPDLYDSHHDMSMADISMFEAGCTAQADGYDALCIDTMSDSGQNALRSVLDIPVISPGRTTFGLMLTLGNKFGVVTQWDPWKKLYTKTAAEMGLQDHLVGVESINTPPDVRNLLGGKEEVVFPKLLAAGLRLVDKGAEAIVLGSTTMHQSAKFLAENLPVPLLNPGPVTYKMAELMLSLKLTHSHVAYPKPNKEKLGMLHAMMDGAARYEADKS